MHSDLESIVRSAIQYPHNPELAPLLGVLYREPVAAPQNCRHPSQQGPLRLRLLALTLWEKVSQAASIPEISARSSTRTRDSFRRSIISDLYL
jgi:hypothetical protein